MSLWTLRTGDRMIRLRPANARERLISLVRYGKITPDEAEAEAAARGWPPFRREPQIASFDPMREGRWSIVMTVAWIAWRDPQQTRQQSAAFRSECTHWVFREWNQPIKRGTSFARRAGWFLESWSEPTTVRLSLVEAHGQSEGTLPTTRQMPVAEAERQLWQALSDGHLVAEGLDECGNPVDVPERAWAYLKLFEDGKRDVLKYDALDRREPYARVRLKRVDVLRHWPPAAQYSPVEEPTSWPIEPYMLSPLSREGRAGYVPLCAALQWIMTDCRGGSAMMDDTAGWSDSVQKLWPLICSGEIELVGLPAGRSLSARIPGSSLTLVKVLPPLRNSIGDVLLGARSHILCTPYIDQEHWNDDFNDRLYETGHVGATWSHLQVSKSQILDRWPKQPSKANVEQDCYRWLLEAMRLSPVQRPQSRGAFWTESRSKFPRLAERQFIRAWQRAISDSGAKWSKSGRPKSNRGGS